MGVTAHDNFAPSIPEGGGTGVTSVAVRMVQPRAQRGAGATGRGRNGARAQRGAGATGRGRNGARAQRGAGATGRGRNGARAQRGAGATGRGRNGARAQQGAGATGRGLGSAASWLRARTTVVRVGRGGECWITARTAGRSEKKILNLG